MIPFQERKKLRKILYSRVTLAVLFVVLVLVAKGAWGIHQKAQIAISEREIAEHSLRELEERTAELDMSLGRLKSGSGMEAEIRQKFDVARSNEQVVEIVDDSSKKGENNEAVGSKGLWQNVSSFFGF